VQSDGAVMVAVSAPEISGGTIEVAAASANLSLGVSHLGRDGTRLRLPDMLVMPVIFQDISRAVVAWVSPFADDQDASGEGHLGNKMALTLR
jgi:hypothetical protein